MLSATLSCLGCGWRTVCGAEQLALRLRRLGLLRRAPHPPDEVVGELLAVHVERLMCDSCGAAGLVVLPRDECDSGDYWQQAVICEVCRQPIPTERLEVVPNSRRCVGCQDLADRGEELDEPEYCPKCGALVELRVSRGGGLTRYKRFCTGDPPCRL